MSESIYLVIGLIISHVAFYYLGYLMSKTFFRLRYDIIMKNISESHEKKDEKINESIANLKLIFDKVFWTCSH
jgi:hypothetical protein